MHKCTTLAAKPQAGRYPVVSNRLLVRFNARNDARRHGVNPAPAIAAAEAEYRSTGGDRFAARRAGWLAVDLQRGQGRA